MLMTITVAPWTDRGANPTGIGTVDIEMHRLCGALRFIDPTRDQQSRVTRRAVFFCELLVDPRSIARLAVL
jgi:hypothetical protein